MHETLTRSVHVVCSWCRSKIRSSEVHGSVPESYGICERCLDGRLARLESTQGLPMPLAPSARADVAPASMALRPLG